MNEVVRVSQPHNVATRAKDDGQLIELFLALKNSKNTKDVYRLAIDQFLFFIQYKPLNKVTLEDMVAYRDLLTDKYSSSHTVRLKLNAIKSLFSFAVGVGYMGFNVGAAIKAPKTPERLDKRYINEDTLSKVISAAKIGRDRILLRLLYATGCRISELLSLNWNDLRANETVAFATVVGKGQKERTIAFQKDLYEEVIKLRSENVPDDSPIFMSQKGNRLCYVQARNIVKTCGVAVGVPDISPHWLRHAHASHALRNGVDINVVKETLGHAHLGITDRYLHSEPGESSAFSLKV